MQFLRHLILPALLWAVAGSTLAQSTNMRDCDNGATSPADNNPERFIGVCNLEDSTSVFTYDSTPGYQAEVQFTVRSCSTWWGETCEQAIPYSVTVSGDNNGSNFILRRNRGNGNQAVAVNLTYASGGSSELLSPDTESSTRFPGGASGLQRPASLTLSLVNPGANLQPGVYIGNFYLTIDQCGSSYTWGTDPEICNGQSNTTQLVDLPFRIELHTQAQIRISGLQDMALTANAGSGAEASQTFCVRASGGALFRISADSASGNGQFLLQGIDQVEYSTTVEHLPSGQGEELTEGLVSSNNWPSYVDEDCQNLGQENMQITVRVAPEALGTAQDTSYTDTLTLTVELE